VSAVLFARSASERDPAQAEMHTVITQIVATSVVRIVASVAGVFPGIQERKCGAAIRNVKTGSGPFWRDGLAWVLPFPAGRTTRQRPIGCAWTASCVHGFHTSTMEPSMMKHRVLSVLGLAAAIGVAGCQNRETEKGDINKAKGEVEQDVGKAVGSDSLTNAGKSDEAKGKLQKAAGDVEHAVKP
jgi:uncharacterized protein YjbJ (UPF0337 family)